MAEGEPRKYRLRSKHFVAQRDAREFCRRFNAKSTLDLLDRVIPVRVSVAAREFIQFLSARSRETRRQYGHTFLFLIERTRDAQLSAIETSHIDEFIAWRLKLSSEATVSKHFRNLRRFFRWAVERGYVARTPIIGVTSVPRHDIRRTKPRISEEQFRALLANIADEDRRLGVLIAATTGLDRSIIRRITREDVDVEHRHFNLVRHKVHRDVHPVIHDAIFASLRQRVDQTPPGRCLLRNLYQGRWWKHAATAAGLPGLQFRDLRTYAVNWLREIVGDFDAQKLVGHSTPLVTAHHYYQANPRAQRLVSERPLPGSPADRAAPKKETA